MKKISTLTLLVALLLPIVCYGQTRPHWAQIENKPGVYLSDHYEVKGDGVTDDSEAIQAIIDANPNKTIYFEDKKYIINSPLDIPKGTSLVGERFLPKYANTGTLLESTASSSVGIVRLGSEGSSGQVSNVIIENISFQGVAWNSTTEGIVGSSSSSLINNCFFSELKTGINIYGTGVTIEKCGFTNGSGALAQGVVLRRESNANNILNCTFFYTLDTSGAAITLYKSAKTNIKDCWFEKIANTAIHIKGALQFTIRDCYFESVAYDIPALGVTGDGYPLKTGTYDGVGVQSGIIDGCYFSAVNSNAGAIHSGNWFANLVWTNNYFTRWDDLPLNSASNTPRLAIGNTSSFWPMATGVNTQSAPGALPRKGMMDSPWFSESLASMGITIYEGTGASITETPGTLYQGNNIEVVGGAGSGAFYYEAPYTYYAGKRVRTRVISSDRVNVGDAVFVGVAYGDGANPLTGASASVRLCSLLDGTEVLTQTGYVDLPDDYEYGKIWFVVQGIAAEAKIHAVDWWVDNIDLITNAPEFIGR